VKPPCKRLRFDEYHIEVYTTKWYIMSKRRRFRPAGNGRRAEGSPVHIDRLSNAGNAVT
jgi:hypothetical protein